MGATCNIQKTTSHAKLQLLELIEYYYFTTILINTLQLSTSPSQIPSLQIINVHRTLDYPTN